MGKGTPVPLLKSHCPLRRLSARLALGTPLHTHPALPNLWLRSHSSTVVGGLGTHSLFAVRPMADPPKLLHGPNCYLFPPCRTLRPLRRPAFKHIQYTFVATPPKTNFFFPDFIQPTSIKKRSTGIGFGSGRGAPPIDPDRR